MVLVALDLGVVDAFFREPLVRQAVRKRTRVRPDDVDVLLVELWWLTSTHMESPRKPAWSGLFAGTRFGIDAVVIRL